MNEDTSAQSVALWAGASMKVSPFITASTTPSSLRQAAVVEALERLGHTVAQFSSSEFRESDILQYR
jgi:hypothetical protein